MRRIEMLTNDFRVDEAITPKLFHLGTVLIRILRIALPMDIFVHCSDELNAFCTASSKGKRLVMCLYSSLLASLSQHELLFVMGHEAGHALLGHTTTPNISYDNPNFSPLEVIRLRTGSRSGSVMRQVWAIGVPGSTRCRVGAFQGFFETDREMDVLRRKRICATL